MIENVIEYCIRNRFLVLFEWAWAYMSWQRGARLITGPWRPKR